MDTSELALVFFSILAQLAVGSFLVLGVVTWLAERKAGKEQADQLAGWGWWAILVVMVLALIASLTHLGNVMNAYLSILNLGSAWLSREILFALLFTGFLALLVLMKWRKIGSASAQMAVWVLGALSGIALVYSMSMIYRYIRTQPAWADFNTTLTFFVTALLLGVLGAGVILIANYLGAKKLNAECKETQCTLVRSALQGIAIAAIVFLGVELIALPVYLTNLSLDAEGGAKTASMIMTEFGSMLTVRLVLVFLGADVLAAYIFKTAANKGKEKMAGNLVYLAFVLVLVAELLGRFIFYVANVRVGL